MFGQRTTAGILGKLSRTVDQLKEHVENSLDDAAFHHDKANDHRQKAYEHEAEAERASRVVEKLNNLIS